MTTPWIDAFRIPDDDKLLSRKLRLEPVPLSLAGMSATAASRTILDALKRVYRPSKQDLRIIRKIVDIFATHACTYYASQAQFLAGAKGKPPLLIDPPVIMLTGPAGVGKSLLVSALERLLCGRESVQLVPDLPPFPHRPVVRAEVESNLSGAGMLSIIADSLGLEQHYGRKTKHDVAHLRLRLYQRGSCGIIPDEMQWLTRSDTSNALAAKILTQLAELRVPIVYVCNYSLGHKLARRPPEDVARFLSAPIVMLPDPPESDDLVLYMKDVQSLFSDTEFEIEPARDSEEFHSMSFGLRRMMGRLYAFGYGRALEERGGKRGSVRVTMNHVRAVYKCSMDYEKDRKTVEGSFASLLGIGESHKDYSCPFELPENDAVMQRKVADKRQQQLLNAAEARASRTGAEKLADQKVRKQPNPDGSTVNADFENERHIKRAPKVRSSSDLLAGI